MIPGIDDFRRFQVRRDDEGGEAEAVGDRCVAAGDLLAGAGVWFLAFFGAELVLGDGGGC